MSFTEMISMRNFQEITVRRYEVGSHYPTQKKDVYAGYSCPYCGANNTRTYHDSEHVFPIMIGTTSASEFETIKICCRECGIWFGPTSDDIEAFIIATNQS